MSFSFPQPFTEGLLSTNPDTLHSNRIKGGGPGLVNNFLSTYFPVAQKDYWGLKKSIKFGKMVTQIFLSKDSLNMVKERILRLRVGSCLMSIGAFTCITLRPIIDGLKDGHDFFYIFQTHNSSILIGIFITILIIIFYWSENIDIRKHLTVSITEKNTKLFLISTFNKSEALVDLCTSKIKKKWNLLNGNFFNKTPIFFRKRPLEMFEITLAEKNRKFYIVPQLFDSEESIKSFINLFEDGIQEDVY